MNLARVNDKFLIDRDNKAQGRHSDLSWAEPAYLTGQAWKEKTNLSLANIQDVTPPSQLLNLRYGDRL